MARVESAGSLKAVTTLLRSVARAAEAETAAVVEVEGEEEVGEGGEGADGAGANADIDVYADTDANVGDDEFGSSGISIIIALIPLSYTREGYTLPVSEGISCRR
ncbi:hypothetical protein GQ44DRAFT_709260 [Phaeosphaeriaceae sp. PMI808]|nr:hypothetical protein GQ44DRAFT_709260 [Phaeosphaeriaceae sp. PMI808]